MEQTTSARRLAGLVDGFSRSPTYVGLADALRELIGDGRIVYGTRLPSERSLTEVLGVSRTTVTRAYELLRESGYAEARQGAGTFTRLPGGPRRATDRALSPGPAGSTDDGVIDLICAAATAPPGIAAAYAEAAADLPAYLGGHGYYPAGLPALQSAIAATYDARGLPTRPEQVIVTAGALAATAVVGAALAGARDKVLVESPTYPNAVEALRTGGGRLVTIPLEPDGWDLDAIEAVLARHRPRLVHVMPDLHNPTGLVMPERTRAAYARLLRRHGGVAVVDEAHHELLLDGQEPRRPFASYAPDAITLGSASKAIWGGLRLGWIRSPLDQVDALTRARVGLDLGAPVLEQLVLVRLLGDTTLLDAHRARLVAQRDALMAALATYLPDWTYRRPDGGMVLWCRLPRPGAAALAAAAEGHGVLLAPGPAFAPEGGLDRWVRLPFTVSSGQLEEAVRRIAAAWAEVEPGTTTPPGRGRPGGVMVA